MRLCERRTTPESVPDPSYLEGSRIPIILLGSRAPIEVSGDQFLTSRHSAAQGLPDSTRRKLNLEIDESDFGGANQNESDSDYDPLGF